MDRVDVALAFGTMASKTSKRGGYAAKPAASRTTSTAPAQPRGTGKTIALPLRLDHDDWETLRRYAFQQRTSIQRIALQGCALIVAKERLTLKGAS